MFSIIVIIILALLLAGYVAIPYIFPSQADPLPDMRDPQLVELEEEKDALFRAIHELDARADLATERRQQLHDRYEAKAARLLGAIDARKQELAGKPPPRPRARRRFPTAIVLLLGLMVVTASVMGTYVFPRIGQDTGITTNDATTIALGEQLKKAKAAVQKGPSTQNLLELGDAYWKLNDAANATTTYQRIVKTAKPVPAIAYQRLGLLTLHSDEDTAVGYLEQARKADPKDLKTLYALGQIYFSQGKLNQAEDALKAYLAAPGGANDTDVQTLLGDVQTVQPLAQKAKQNPSEPTLMALGDAYWQVQQQGQAASVYVQVVSNYNPHQERALSRIGQVLFFSGRVGDAITVLEHAKEIDANDLDTLLVLGNAYFTKAEYQKAINTWQTYVKVAGGPEKAGRVPGLIQQAKDKLNGVSGSGVEASSPGGRLYASYCSGCHGDVGQGGIGPALAGNPAASSAAIIEDTVKKGRGTMPAFGGQFSKDELDSLAQYVSSVIYSGGKPE